MRSGIALKKRRIWSKKIILLFMFLTNKNKWITKCSFFGPIRCLFRVTFNPFPCHKNKQEQIEFTDLSTFFFFLFMQSNIWMYVVYWTLFLIIYNIIKYYCKSVGLNWEDLYLISPNKKTWIIIIIIIIINWTWSY
jgi:hypothetical protein